MTAELDSTYIAELCHRETITLDVGGQIFRTHISNVSESKFFYEHIEEIRITNEDGKPFFIDQSYKAFEHILNLLRDSLYEFPTKYIAALDFYGIDTTVPNIKAKMTMAEKIGYCYFTAKIDKGLCGADGCNNQRWISKKGWWYCTNCAELVMMESVDPSIALVMYMALKIRTKYNGEIMTGPFYGIVKHMPDEGGGTLMNVDLITFKLGAQSEDNMIHSYEPDQMKPVKQVLRKR